jgi:putative hydrolase of the HAD superfamily
VTATVHGVLVDLDDTVYPQAEFLDAAWQAVAECGVEFGLDRAALLTALRRAAAAGSDRGGIIDRALASMGASELPVAAFLAAFRSACPARLTSYPGVPEALAELRRRVPIALISDGDVPGQQRKLAALGLADAFDFIVFSDRWGREFRKPHPRPFQAALRELTIPAKLAVMIGDRPDKDIAGALAADVRAIRVRTGEYSASPDHPATWLCADTFADAARAVLPHLLTVRPAGS